MCVWVDETKVLYMNFYKLNVFTSEEACYFILSINTPYLYK